jgi:hypothetical protein
MGTYLKAFFRVTSLICARDLQKRLGSPLDKGQNAFAAYEALVTSAADRGEAYEVSLVLDGAKIIGCWDTCPEVDWEELENKTLKEGVTAFPQGRRGGLGKLG